MASGTEDGDGGVFDDVFVDDVTVEEQRRLEVEQLKRMMKILMEKDRCERRKIPEEAKEIAALIAMRNKLMEEMLVKKEEIKELERELQRERKILEQLRETIKIRKETAALKHIIDISLLFLILFASFVSFFLFQHK
ncbi:hypothetical protein AABB24_031160 [Solanum stoloniferum]|uniref:Uncharacterized protein n=1 Tax=Solanum stoloniferum TaxID=62892 RepID=A0ABD2RSF5_9SOLN